MYNSDRRVPAKELRRLATWYRDFAERAGSSTIWEARLHMAEDLEREAARVGVLPWIPYGRRPGELGRLPLTDAR